MARKLILFPLLVSVLFLAVELSAEDQKGAPVTIQYFSGWNEGEPYVPLFKKIIADFEAANPRIKVNATWNGRENLTKVRPMLLSGNVPEIMDQGADELTGALVSQDLTFALDKDLALPAAGSKSAWKDTFKPGQLDAYKKGGETHIVPWWIDTTAFYYNGKLFSQKGFSAPKTWDEFTSLADKMKAGGLAPLAQDGGVNFYNVYYFRHLVQRIMGNGALLKASGDKSGGSWDDPGFLKAAKLVEQLAKKGYFIKGFEGYTYPAGQIDFVKGKAAMILISTWLPAETKDSIPAGFEYRSFPVPTVAAGKGKAADVELYQWSFVVLKDAAHKAEAVQFLKFWTQKKYNDEMAINHDAMIAIKGTANPPSNPDAAKLMDIASSTSRFNDGVNSALPEYWQTVLLPADDSLIFGKVSAEQFIAQLKKDSKAFWNK
jgi:raffinose/stachyose/melibiose transport system substrate-binding protein